LRTRVALAALLLGWLLPGIAAAQDDGGWVIESFTADITVAPDGALRVVEDIAVDFDILERHGIYRTIPVRYDLAGDVNVDIPEGRTPDEYFRAIDIADIEVTSSAPNNLDISRPGPFDDRDLSIRIGDEDITVTGKQTYRISYTVRGALNGFEGRTELYWNATGTGWPVPIQQTRAVVHAPRIARGTCYRGPVGSSALCDGADVTGRAATFNATGLAAGEGLTFVASFPATAVDAGTPLLVEKWTLPRALSGHPLAWPLTAFLGAVAIGGVVALAFRQGRDRVTRGPMTVDGRLDTGGERRPLLSPRITPVEFHPPDQLPPALIGVLVDERVDPVDIAATIVDLAVRKHLRIVEATSKVLWISRTDWTLERLNNPDDPLEPYERRLLDGLFSGGSSVDLSDLKGKFAADYKKVSESLYEHVAKQGWFARRPDRIRALWLGLGVVALIAGSVLFVVALMYTQIAVAALPIVVGGLLLIIVHRWMPHRTAAGSRMLDRALGFREYITTAETGRAGFAAEQNLFIQYLPYAVVFGAVDKWARAFRGLDITSDATMGYWYVGSHADGFDMTRLSSGLSDFSAKVSGTLPVSASSGGSGFSGGGSGGGFGGGGGGSW
jgi:hypothetical protein